MASILGNTDCYCYTSECNDVIPRSTLVLHLFVITKSDSFLVKCYVIPRVTGDFNVLKFARGLIGYYRSTVIT